MGSFISDPGERAGCRCSAWTDLFCSCSITRYQKVLSTQTKGRNMDNDIATGDVKLNHAIKQWLQFDKNPKTLAAVRAMLKGGSVEELRRCFGARMEFGTAGLRAAMGPGISCMNDLTIIQTTQGLCRYLEQRFSDLKARGVVIGFDARAHPESGGAASASPASPPQC
ncbi:hypothetical protein ANANG_G00094440 [Anguilla anguilla]|uniref:Alpha-D-phosphohexomutase alpha/beta/alpha domain-containing protein n=1 Tax=Anguilla anguilla TaxID=7936 RepID=A0A9D3MIU1_ANGAN|nr:hypothetical protein ANANG_G00094440 [Anguilla anguilla]